MKDKKKLIIITIITMVVMIATIGITFAMFMYSETGETSKLVLGDIWMKYTEKEGISLQNAKPGDDYSDYFEFTITGTNTYEKNDIWYDVILSNGEVPEGKEEINRIDSRYLNFKLVEVTEDGEKVIFEDKTYNDLNNRRVYVSTIQKNTTGEYSKTYRMYMALNKKLEIGNTSTSVMTMEDFKNVFASVKVSVTGDLNEKQMPGTMARLGTAASKFWSDEIENVKSSIKEVNFIQLDNNEINTRYNAATIKSDVTTVEEFPIKVWLETNEIDSTMYTMYIASEEEIYFPSNSSRIFYNFRNLVTTNFKNINANQAENISYMFSNCINLVDLDLSNFNPTRIKYMEYTFYECSSLIRVNLENFNTSNVISMSQLFRYCSNLTEIKGIEKFDTSQVTNMSYMFAECSSLTNLDLSNFNTSKVAIIASMFNGCVKLENLDISNFNFENIGQHSYYRADIFKNVGSSLETGINTTIYVKNDYQLNGTTYSPQNFVLTTSNVPSTWSTSNVIVKQ